jgi:hypothetical protein
MDYESYLIDAKIIHEAAREALEEYLMATQDGDDSVE